MDGKRSTFIVYFLDRILEKSMGRWVKKGANSHGLTGSRVEANLRGPGLTVRA